MDIRWLHPGRLLDGNTGECQWDNVAPSSPMPVPSAAGGGGEPAPQSDASTTDSKHDSTATAGAATPEPEPEEELFAPVTRVDDEDDGHQSADLTTLQSKYKALRKDHRRALRRLEKQNAAAGVLQGQDVRQTIADAQAYRNLQAAAQANPKLRALLFGEDEPPSGRAKGDEDEGNDLPFDTSDPVGKFFAERIKRDSETIKALTARLDAIEGKDQRTTLQTEQATWKDAVTGAAAKIPPEYREMFSDAVYGAYQESKKRNAPIKPQQVIDHYLKRLNLSQGQQARASAAAAQSIAEANRGLPRAQAGGQPASARPRGEKVADVSKRLRAFGR